MSGKILTCLMVLLAALLFAGCNEKEVEETADDEFDVEFVLPSRMETTTGLLTFEVLNHKNPLLTDSFVLEPVSSSGGSVSYSYSCTITETSAWSFTVSLPMTCQSGQFNVYIRRGDQRKSYGVLSFDYVAVGMTLPQWYEGALDIHFISTGHGECTWQILPDGTTFLVDASGSVTDWGTSWYRPSADFTAGQVIVDYINHFTPAVSAGHINYFLLSHHHGDHMGTYSSDMPDHSSGQFKLTSVCEIGSKLVMDKIFDRDWPDFSYPTKSTSSMMTNYKNFLNWTAEENGTVIEKWSVGSRTQITPVNNKNYSVSYRSYAGSGYFWTGGMDEDTYTLMPTAEEFATMDSDDIPDENQFSCVYILTYGKFDFYAGGDIMYISYTNYSDDIADIPYPYFDAESPMIDKVHKVEVMKMNHHGYKGSHVAGLANKLCPDVALVGAWGGSDHPSPGPARRLLEANPNCEFFCTLHGSTTHRELVAELGDEEVTSRFVSTYGHTVIRVAPGGETYMIYTLEDTDQEYTVKSIHGPYTCVD